MHSSNELEGLSSGNGMWNRAVISVTPPAEAVVNASIYQHQTLKTGQSNTEARVPLIKEQLGIYADSLTDGLCKHVEQNPEKVGWIGDPLLHPLAVIRGPSGPFVISKKVVIIGRDSGNSITDVVVQESSYIDRCHVILYYTGQPNKWNIKVNGKNGVLVNEVMYGRSEQAQSIPISCILRFPSTHVSMLFYGLEALSAPENKISSIVKVSESEMNSAVSLADSEMTFYLSKSHTEENTSISTTEQSEPVQTPTDSSAGANVSTESPSSTSTSDFDSKCKGDYETSDEKPPYSYAQLIVQAILSSPDHQMTLSGIYNYIMNRYPWYRSTDKGWQNSIRHNLSLNRYFVKVARSQEERGKGSFWRMESSFAPRNVELAYRKRKPKLSKGNKVSNPVMNNDSKSAEDTIAPIDRSLHSEKDNTMSSVQKNDVLRKDMLRFARSAPCSPKNVLSRSNFRSGGPTFRVCQSAKDGRSRLQLCPSAPEYRSINSNKLSEALSLSSDTSHMITSHWRNGTKSLSTTPVPEMLQELPLISSHCLNETVTGSSGLKPQDLRHDLIVMSDSNRLQYYRGNRKKAQSHHSNKHQSSTYFAQAESFISEKVIVTPSAKAPSYGREQKHSSSFKTSDMQEVIGIKKYGEDAKVLVENEVVEENAYSKCLPIMRNYGVDESVKLNACETKRSSREKFLGDMLIQRKRTYVEADAGSEAQEDHNVTEKPRKAGEISTHPTEEVVAIKQAKIVSKQLASSVAQISNGGAVQTGNPSLTIPLCMKSETVTRTNSNFLAQQLQTADHMNESRFSPSTIQSSSVLNKLKLGSIVCSAKSELLPRKSCTETSQHQSNFAANLNSQLQTTTSAAIQSSYNWQISAGADAERAPMLQPLLGKSDMLNTLQPSQLVNTPGTKVALQNLSSFSSLLSDAVLMPEVLQSEAAAHMQYQSIQPISACAESLERLSNYVNYLKKLEGVPVQQSQSQSLNLFAPLLNEQQHQKFHGLQPQTQPQFALPNYSLTFPTNLLDHNLNLNIGQWFNYMRLLAVQPSSTGLYIPPVIAPLWNPQSVITPQGPCAQASIFSYLEKDHSNLMTQHNSDNTCANNGAQYSNHLEMAKILASISNMPSAQ